jgi:hypothetical protein
MRTEGRKPAQIRTGLLGRARPRWLAAALPVALFGSLLAVLAAPQASAAVVSGTTYTVVNVNSGKCVDASAAGTANGTAVQQYSCNGTGAQKWIFTSTSNGYFQVGTVNAPAQVWDDTNVSSADGSLIQLWTYGGGNNQQWQPVLESGSTYHFVNRYSGKCLDTPSASTADSVQLQQYTCNGTGAQSFTLNPISGGGGGGGSPFGPNVKIFDPSMSSSAIQSQLDSIFNQQQSNEFGSQRYAVLFKPGTYNNDVNLGFYTQALGLGLNPDDVTINGGVHVSAAWMNGNATLNFWRGAENLAVNPPNGTDVWAVSQASPLRRVDIHGNLQLDDGGWSSGGFLADAKVTGQVRSGSQQQWLSRDTSWGSWTGSNWNMVFVGSQNAPAQSFPNPPYTVVNQAPVVREKPFLYVDSSGNYQVFVPALRTNSSGISWGNGTTPPGTSLPISQFYIAMPGDSADTINAALAAGKNLLFTPGIFHLGSAIHVTRPDTVVLGLGIATLTPDNGNAAMMIDDVNGVNIAGLLFDAGQNNSPVLLQVGQSGSTADHSADPVSLSDVFFRIGGAAVGKATQSLVVNSNNVLIDDTWIWRADHGNGVGWYTNTAANGLIVNGNNVTAYGLFVEHFQQYQVIWNGNGGRTYFFQNEMPYDVPDQATWRSGANGYAAYKVADPVTDHQAFGVGSYCYFSTNPNVVADRAFEVPYTAGVRFHDLVTVSLGGTGTINNIINNTGGSVGSGHTVADLVNYP